MWRLEGNCWTWTFTSSTRRRQSKRRSPCFGHSSAVGRMCTRADSKAGRRAGLATRRPARTSGYAESARSLASSAPSVLNRRFLPVTDTVMRWHLSGFDDAGQPFVAGVYPLLLDETCFFLAADFDKAGWEQDALAFVERLPPPEYSRRSRTLALWTWRARVAVLRRGPAGRPGSASGIARADRSHGGPT